MSASNIVEEEFVPFSFYVINCVGLGRYVNDRVCLIVQTKVVIDINVIELSRCVGTSRQRYES